MLHSPNTDPYGEIKGDDVETILNQWNKRDRLGDIDAEMDAEEAKADASLRGQTDSIKERVLSRINTTHPDVFLSLGCSHAKRAETLGTMDGWEREPDQDLLD